MLLRKLGAELFERWEYNVDHAQYDNDSLSPGGKKTDLNLKRD
jgi:hypothetical protein